MKQIKTAFDRIKADEAMINKTKNSVVIKMQRNSKRVYQALRLGVPVLAVMFIMIVAGSFIYLTPTVCVSVDINPSLELSLNRFDRVIDAKGLNQEGKELADSLNLKHLSCENAIEKLVGCREIEALLEEDATLEIGVVGEENTQTQRLYSEIEKSTDNKAQTYCYRAKNEDVERARNLGISYGKYKAYQEILSLGGDVSVEQIQNMPMNEIKKLISSFTETDESFQCETESDTSGNGKGKPHNHGNRKN